MLFLLIGLVSAPCIYRQRCIISTLWNNPSSTTTLDFLNEIFYFQGLGLTFKVFESCLIRHKWICIHILKIRIVLQTILSNMMLDLDFKIHIQIQIQIQTLFIKKQS